jgi:hypothetical protein
MMPVRDQGASVASSLIPLGRMVEPVVDSTDGGYAGPKLKIARCDLQPPDRPANPQGQGLRRLAQSLVVQYVFGWQMPQTGPRLGKAIASAEPGSSSPTSGLFKRDQIAQASFEAAGSVDEVVEPTIL